MPAIPGAPATHVGPLPPHFPTALRLHFLSDLLSHELSRGLDAGDQRYRGAAHPTQECSLPPCRVQGIWVLVPQGLEYKRSGPLSAALTSRGLLWPPPGQREQPERCKVTCAKVHCQHSCEQHYGAGGWRQDGASRNRAQSPWGRFHCICSASTVSSVYTRAALPIGNAGCIATCNP